MSRKYKVLNPEGVYFITCTIIDWVDLLTRPVYKDILISSLRYCIRHKGLNLHAYVFMTNHIHLLISSKYGHYIPNVMRDFKTHTSKKLIEEVKLTNESRSVWLLNKFSFAANRQVRGKFYKVWQDGYHPKEILSHHMLYQKLNYIHNNPVKDRIVEKPEEYIYSSARNYAGLAGEIEVEYIV